MLEDPACLPGDALREIDAGVPVLCREFGEDGVQFLVFASMRASLLFRAAGRRDEALKLYEKVAPRLEKALGASDPRTKMTWQQYAECLAAAGMVAKSR